MYTTVLVAFCVAAPNREAAMDQVMSILPREAKHRKRWDRAGLDCWWIAEDDRTDGSDNDSAVFIPQYYGPMITQAEAHDILEEAVVRRWKAKNR